MHPLEIKTLLLSEGGRDSELAKLEKKLSDSKLFCILKPHSHSADMAQVHPGEGQPVYRDEPGHFS